MVRFCNGCKRAIDDLDKFCRSCGHDAGYSIDYYTYYRSFVKEDIEQKALAWFTRGKDIAVREEIRKLNEKVDRMYLKLFPPSVGELREDLDKIIDKEEEKPLEIKEEKKEEKPPEMKEEKILDIKKVYADVDNMNDLESLCDFMVHYNREKDLIRTKIKEEIKEEKPEIKEEIKEEKPEIKEEIKEEKLEIKEEIKEEKPPEKKDEFLTQDDVERSKLELENYIKESNSQTTEKPLEIKVEKREDEEDWPWPGVDKEVSKEQGETTAPQEVNDKLNILLQEDEGQRQAVQYLIDKYNKNRGKNVGGNAVDNISGNKSSTDINAGPGIAIIPSEDVVRIGRVRGKGKEKGEPYKMYDIAIHPFIPDILKSIESSKDGMIRVRLLDIAKKMGEKFIDKKPVTVYTGLKYTLFDHNIVVEMGSLKAVDPVTKENIKILKMRMKNPDDTLPPSLLERRGEME